VEFYGEFFYCLGGVLFFLLLGVFLWGGLCFFYCVVLYFDVGWLGVCFFEGFFYFLGGWEAVFYFYYG